MVNCVVDECLLAVSVTSRRDICVFGAFDTPERRILAWRRSVEFWRGAAGLCTRVYYARVLVPPNVYHIYTPLDASATMPVACGVRRTA